MYPSKSLNMPRKITEEFAVELMRNAGLEPNEPYVDSKQPWLCTHMACGRQVSPTYNAIQRGQGGCAYCAGKKVDSSDAEAFIRSKGFEPLEPYSGNKKPWKVLHVTCNKETTLKYNTLQQGETQGCRNCSKVIVDADEAFVFFKSRDLIPLVPYPGAKNPWKSIHTVCGNVIAPRYGHIKSGRVGCLHCAGTIPITQEKAVALFRESGLEPQGKFPGPHVPWTSIHLACGRTTSPRYAAIQQGQGACKYCAGNAVNETEAIDFMERKGLSPLVEFPGANMPWRCIHASCGKEVSPTYGSVRSGQGGCKFCGGRHLDQAEARAKIISLGFTPIDDYQPQSRWRVIHDKCGTEILITYRYTVKTGKGCSSCAGLKPISKGEVVEVFEKNGFTLVGEFVNTRTPIKAIHNVCKREVFPRYGDVKNGRGCKFCQVGGINLNLPGFIYVMTNEELSAVKVGIGGDTSKTNRINQHKKFGWTLYKRMNLSTAEEAYEVEQSVISWLREDLGLPIFLSSEEMPQGGHTETFSAEEIDSWTIWEEVIRVAGLRTPGNRQ
jgi:recombinational DNA repair protein (RecF pathway)